MLELLTGAPHMRVVELMYDDEDFYAHVDRHLDARAGAWPAAVVAEVAAVAEHCLQYRSTNRAAVRDVLPRLTALQLQPPDG